MGEGGIGLVFGIGDQTCSHRIAVNVGDGALEVLFVANGTIEVVSGLEWVFTFEGKIDAAGSAALPTADAFSQAGFRVLPDQEVDMLRLDAPGDEFVIHIMAIYEGVFDDAALEDVVAAELFEHL
ncbi:MAG: hypothetical protein ACSHX9_11915 [Luteolibacter sp.]